MTCGVDLSPSQHKIIEAIRVHTDAHHHAPTTRELADVLGIAPSAVHGTLVRLRTMGLVTWSEGQARTLRVLDGDDGAALSG